MENIISHSCPKCNSHLLYKYVKDKIALMFKILYNIKLSHVTISDWCKKFAPIFHSKMLTLMSAMNFDSDEWHADETVVKILGKKYYTWFIIDSETRFVL